MVPLLDARLKEREAAGSGRQTTLTRHARDLVRVDAEQGKSFADFAAFDLSLDQAAAGVLKHIRSAVPATDVLANQLTCLWHLIYLEPNPEAVAPIPRSIVRAARAARREGRIRELPAWLGTYRDLSDRLRESRPDVSETLASYLSAFCTVERAAWIADVSIVEPDGKSTAAAMIGALGPALGKPFTELSSATRSAMLRRARLRQGDELSFRCSPSMPHSSRRLLPRCSKGERPACSAPSCELSDSAGRGGKSP